MGPQWRWCILILGALASAFLDCVSPFSPIPLGRCLSSVRANQALPQFHPKVLLQSLNSENKGGDEESDFIDIDETVAKQEWEELGFDPKLFTIEKFIAYLENGEEDDGDWEEVTTEELSRRNYAEAGSSNAPRTSVLSPGVEDWQMGRSVGIDLGTTNSAVGYVDKGRPVLVSFSSGRKTIPSAVAWVKEEQEGSEKVLTGEDALMLLDVDPSNVFVSAKRLIGRTRGEASSAGVKLGQMGVHKDFDTIRLKLPARKTTIEPERVSAELLKRLLTDASRHIGDGHTVSRAVITVPAYFTPNQCAATERAGTLAGLQKVKLLREPEAAALAYGLGRSEDELIMVFDLGGGTFDVSILYVGGGLVEVIATSGDNQLGGDNFDERIASWLVDECAEETRINPRADPIVMKSLVSVAQKARIALSNSKETDINVPDLGISVTLTRKKMEQLCLPLLQRILQPMREAAIMAGAGLPGDSGELIISSTAAGENEGQDYNLMDPNSSLSADKLRELEKKQRDARKNAKKQRKNKQKQREAFSQVRQTMETGKLRAFPTGTSIDQVIMVGGATRMPCVQKLVEGVTGALVRATADPDEAVALGAAIYAGIIDGDVTDLDVLSSWQAAVMRSLALSQRQSQG